MRTMFHIFSNFKLRIDNFESRIKKCMLPKRLLRQLKCLRKSYLLIKHFYLLNKFAAFWFAVDRDSYKT